MQTSGNVKLKLKAKGNWGKKLILPVVGAVEIGTDGVFEVEDHVATILLRQSNDFFLVEGNGTTVDENDYSDKMETKPESSEKVIKKADKEEEETEESEEESTEESEEEEEENDGLEDMKLSELLEVASAGGFEEEEYVKFKKNKKLMIAFLRKNAKSEE